MNEADLRKKKNKRLAMVFVLLIALLLAFVFWRITERADYLHSRRPTISGTILAKPMPLAQFSLDGFKGEFTNKNFIGHWTLLFFGFSNCPYVCPTTLAQLNLMFKQLKAEGLGHNLPQVVMVSVDPERDSVERMHSYVTSFNPAFIGLRTSEANTSALTKAMTVSFAKVQAPGDDSKRYTITHTATITVVGPQGKIRAYLSYPHKARVMARDYSVIIRSQGR
jgi:protein SCO1